MSDLLFVLITIAFFLAAAGYVALCDRIIGPDQIEVEETAGDAAVTR